MRRSFIVLVGFGFWITGWAHPQRVTPGADPAAAYLLRLERAHYLESVCVLLKADGQYHLERHIPRDVRVFEGRLKDAELQNIVRILSGDLLFRLDQTQIPDLMLKSDHERVTLEIHRPSSWQQLLFKDSASREPFRDAMEPLLNWLDSINKRKKRAFSEEAGRNNCLPPGSTEFAKRPAPPNGESLTTRPGNDPMAGVEAPVSPLAPYTLLMYETRFFGYRPKVSCLLVSTTGTYHLVTQTRTDKGLNTGVLDGTLAPSQLASLRSVLDDPEVTRQPEEQHVGEIMMTSDGYFTRLFIPRGRITQNFAAWKSYRLVNQVMSDAVEDHGTQLLVPFRDWLKNNIDDKTATATSNPANPRCVPGK